MQKIRLALLAYVSAVPMLFGFLAGIFWHRVLDGWKLSRSMLDDLDDAMNDLIKETERDKP